jgi:hypothetical protein
MARPIQDDDEEELTPENVIKAREELTAMGLIVDSGERRNGEIVWITAEEAARRRRG